MRIFLVLAACGTLLSACGGSPGRSLDQAAAEGIKFGTVGEVVVHEAVSINACPAGMRAVGVDITTGSAGVITNVNGRTNTTLSADGKREQRCIVAFY